MTTRPAADALADALDAHIRKLDAYQWEDAADLNPLPLLEQARDFIRAHSTPVGESHKAAAEEIEKLFWGDTCVKATDEFLAEIAAILSRHLPSGFEEGMEAAANLMGEITGEGITKPAPGYCAGGWKIDGDQCPKCGATSNQNCPGDLFDGEKVAARIRALKRPAVQPAEETGNG
jgi:hypothetical protein